MILFRVEFKIPVNKPIYSVIHNMEVVDYDNSKWILELLSCISN